MRVDPGSTVPLFTQIVNEIQSAIVAGLYAEGERIPSARDMALLLKVNPNTVQKAYAELVDLGVLESRRGIGKFVCKRGSRSALRQSEDSIADLIRQAVELGRSAKFTDKRLREIFSEVLSATPKRGIA